MVSIDVCEILLKGYGHLTRKKFDMEKRGPDKNSMIWVSGEKNGLSMLRRVYGEKALSREINKNDGISICFDGGSLGKKRITINSSDVPDVSLTLGEIAMLGGYFEEGMAFCERMGRTPSWEAMKKLCEILDETERSWISKIGTMVNTQRGIRMMALLEGLEMNGFLMQNAKTHERKIDKGRRI